MYVIGTDKGDYYGGSNPKIGMLGSWYNDSRKAQRYSSMEEAEKDIVEINKNPGPKFNLSVMNDPTRF